MSAAHGFPPSALTIDASAQRVTLVVDAQLYPRDAIYAATSPFFARAFVLLDRTDEGEVSVGLQPREPLDEAGLRALAGDLANELLTAAARVGIAGRRRGLIEAMTRRAIAGAMGPPALDDLEAFDLDGDAFEDPLGIADSWEARHGKDGKP